MHATRNGHLDVAAYLLTCDWVVSRSSEEVELSEAAQQALVAAAAQGHNEVSAHQVFFSVIEQIDNMLKKLTRDVVLVIN